MEVCKTCANWVKRPLDPQNLGQPPVGECRGMPPQLIVLPTPQGINVTAAYPTVPPEFPACGLHARRELPVLQVEG